MKITFYAKNKDPPVSSNSFAIMDTVWYILLIVCIGPPGARFNPKKIINYRIILHMQQKVKQTSRAKKFKTNIKKSYLFSVIILSNLNAARSKNT